MVGRLETFAGSSLQVCVRCHKEAASRRVQGATHGAPFLLFVLFAIVAGVVVVVAIFARTGKAGSGECVLRCLNVFRAVRFCA